jgi:hypothetical protein
VNASSRLDRTAPGDKVPANLVLDGQLMVSRGAHLPRAVPKELRKQDVAPMRDEVPEADIEIAW